MKVSSFVTLLSDLSMIYDQVSVIDLDLQIIHPKVSTGTSVSAFSLPGAPFNLLKLSGSGLQRSSRRSQIII